MQRYVKLCAPPIASIYPPIYNINYDHYALPPLQTKSPTAMVCSGGYSLVGGDASG